MNIIELAKEAGFTGCLLPEESDDLIGGVFIDDENWIKPLERFAALVIADRDKDYLRLESDFVGKFDATKDNVFVAIKAIATGVYEQ